MSTFGKASRQRLDTCDEQLQKLFEEVLKEADITILCGHRDEKEQDAAFKAGLSKTPWPTSRHNSLPSTAADVAPYPIDWNNIERFKQLAVIVKKVAHRLAIDVEWGGDWGTFLDYPHWQLKAKKP